MSGLTRQPAQKKFSGNTGKDHAWRHKVCAGSKPKLQKPQSFVCVSCGDANCVAGECTTEWEPK